MMEEKIVNAFSDLGYKETLVTKENLDSILQDGIKSIEFSKLIKFLTDEIRGLLNIDEQINEIANPEDAVSFVLEVSSFLKELNCPYSNLTQGHVSDRLQKREDLLLLVDFLATELMAARILQEKRPNKKIELKLQETEEGADLRKIFTTLRFPKPPPNITIPQLFQKLEPTVQSTIQKAHPQLLRQPALKGTLSDVHWNTLQNLQSELHHEYKIRREMMLTRLDVTIQSFQWSDKTKGKNEIFEKIYGDKRKTMKADPDVTIADVLAARDDVAIIEKTSSASVRQNTKSELNKVIIGQVPDRGGRTSEQAPPPPEMPSWQQRQAGPSRGGRGGNRGGGNRNQQQQQRSFDSAGSYGGNDGRNNQGYDNRQQQQDNRQYYDNRQQQYERPFDSAGSYGGRQDNYYEQQQQQTHKRPKTYDSYQSNRTTYADQYMQEDQHNQQYRGAQGRGRGDNRRGGRGRSNYHRGGGGRSNYY